jgi:DNA-binding MarR family transcriptional regulator
MTERPEILELAEPLRMLFRKLSLEWARHIDPPLSGSQATILEKLETEGQQKASSLAEALGITSGAVTGLSDKLISSGLAKRKRTDDDRRIVYLEITERGREMLKTIREKRSFILHSFFAGIPEEDIRLLIRVFDQVLLQHENQFRE